MAGWEREGHAGSVGPHDERRGASSMLTSIGILVLVVAIALFITVDVARTPTEAPAGQAEHPGYEPGRAFAGTRSVTGAHAFPREPALRDKAGPVEAGSFSRPDEVVRVSDQMDRSVSPSAGSEAAVRARFSAMSVNLSRRSQALVERQLRLIESLEHGEQDPHRLTSLAKLNRIAMRMHRNSQNLLVLAGQEPTTGWNQPVTLAHLVEAALAEIEDYERVSFQVQPDIAVRGPAVHDAVHLLVELIDNATSFSAAEMPVQITGRILTSGGALVDITDRGIGMAANEMAYANQQLDNPPPPDIDVPKWMGLLVVGHLAARHGIRVRLNPAEFGGLSALVWFPDEILTHYRTAADPGHAAAGARATRAGPSALASVRTGQPDTPMTRPEPAWAGGAHAMVQAEPAAAARLSGSSLADASGEDGSVVSPAAESRSRTRRLPIFDEVESHWPRGAHEAPSSPTLAPSSGPAASGLPRRSSPGTQGPRATPGTPNRPGRQGWGTPAEEPDPGGPDES
jgi:hypothetical protein